MSLIKTITLLKNRTIAAGTTVRSEIIDLNKFAKDGTFSLENNVTGTGTLQVTYEISSGKEVFFTPPNAQTIFTGQTAGREIVDFEVPFVPWMRLIFTETGSANAVVIDSFLNIK